MHEILAASRFPVLESVDFKSAQASEILTDYSTKEGFKTNTHVAYYLTILRPRKIYAFLLCHRIEVFVRSI